MGNKILTVEDINVYYGAIHAVKGVSFDVEEGDIVTLIGANGAGKSTTLQTVSGLLRSKTGSISFLDENITKLAPHKILKRGLAQVPDVDDAFHAQASFFDVSTRMAARLSDCEPQIT